MYQSNMQVEITIPTYNEEKILKKSITTLASFLNKTNLNYTITIADNASEDNTLKIANNLAKKYNNVAVFHTKKPGRGNALKQVWKNSPADILCYMDADLSTDISFLIRMIDTLKKYDLVVGNRLDRNSITKRSIYRTILSKGYNALIKYLLKIKTNDIQCGFKCIKKTAFMKLINKTKNDGWFFDTELVVWAEKKNFKVAQIPIKWIERSDSKVKIYSAIKDYLFQMYQLRKKLKKVRMLK